jgi:hypothetical protein
MGRRGDKITPRGIAAPKVFERWTRNGNESLLNKLSRFCKLVVNPVRNSRRDINPPGIILTFKPDSEQRSIISNGVKGKGVIGKRGGEYFTISLLLHYLCFGKFPLSPYLPIFSSKCSLEQASNKFRIGGPLNLEGSSHPGLRGNIWVWIHL